MADLSMHEGMPVDEEATPSPVSTGELPQLEEVREIVAEAYERYRSNADGTVADYIPVLAVMATAGLYELSGDWLYEIGIPGKSGVSGGIVTVAPGKGGLATFSPPLDAAGNSVRGQLVTKFLAERLGLNLFASQAAPQD